MIKTIDEGARLTDVALSALEKRVSAAYDQAAKDLKTKIDDFEKAFDKKDKAMQAKVEAGKLKQAEYEQWKLNQIGQKSHFEKLENTMAKRYVKADEVATIYINDTTPGVYTLNRNFASYDIERQAGDVGFSVLSESTVKRLIKEDPNLMPNYPAEKAVERGIDLAKSKVEITKSVTQGILQGESIPKIAKRLTEGIPSMKKSSAIRAARTAVTGAQNGGRQDTYLAAEEMGIELKKEWQATLDGRTRPEHRKLDGQQVAVDEPFEADGYEIMYPGDPDAAPEMVYNCRCCSVAAVAGVEDKGKRVARTTIVKDNGDEIQTWEEIPYMTYSEWEEWKKNGK